MKRLLLVMLAGAVFATPCVYDAFSLEPSPLAGLDAAYHAVAAGR